MRRGVVAVVVALCALTVTPSLRADDAAQPRTIPLAEWERMIETAGANGRTTASRDALLREQARGLSVEQPAKIVDVTENPNGSFAVRVCAVFGGDEETLTLPADARPKIADWKKWDRVALLHALAIGETGMPALSRVEATPENLRRRPNPGLEFPAEKVTPESDEAFRSWLNSYATAMLRDDAPGSRTAFRKGLAREFAFEGTVRSVSGETAQIVLSADVAFVDENRNRWGLPLGPSPVPVTDPQVLEALRPGMRCAVAVRLEPAKGYEAQLPRAAGEFPWRYRLRRVSAK